MAKCFQLKRTVEFHETDAAGFVHFSNFFTYMEEAEHAFLNSLNIPVYEKSREGWFGWPRVRASCNYLAPLNFQDEFEIELRVVEISIKTVLFKIRFLKIENDDRTEAANGEITSIYARRSLSDNGIDPMSIPKHILEKVRPYTI